MNQNPMINLPREAVESLLNNPPGHPDAVKARDDLLAHLSIAEQISAAGPSDAIPTVKSAQNQPRSITGHVSAYTPGMNLVEVRLPKSAPIPAWLELGEKINLVEIPAPEVNDEQ